MEHQTRRMHELDLIAAVLNQRQRAGLAALQGGYQRCETDGEHRLLQSPLQTMLASQQIEASTHSRMLERKKLQLISCVISACWLCCKLGQLVVVSGSTECWLSDHDGIPISKRRFANLVVEIKHSVI
jgi:hypothetical protein